MDGEEILDNLSKIHKKLSQDKEETEKALQHANAQEKKQFELLKEIVASSTRFPSHMHYQEAVSNIRASLFSHRLTATQLQQKATEFATMQKHLEERANIYAQQRFMQERAKQIESMKARQRAEAEVGHLERLLGTLMMERTTTIGTLRNIESMVQRVVAERQQLLEMHGIVTTRAMNADDEPKGKRGNGDGGDGVQVTEEQPSDARPSKPIAQAAPAGKA